MLRSILSNAAYSLIADVVSRLASVVLLIAITRKLGESAAGVYTLSTNYVLILSAVAFWGLDQLLIRDVAQDRGVTTKHFVHFFLVRLALAPALWLLLAALLLGVHAYQPATGLFIAVAGGTILGGALSNLGQSLLVAYERVWPVSLISLASGTLLVAAGLAVLRTGGSLQALALLLVLVSLLQAVTMSLTTLPLLNLKSFRLDLRFCLREMGAGFPFVPISVFIALEGQLGSILLSFFHGEAVVGFYAMANTIITSLALLSQSLRVGIFPVMARLWKTDQPGFMRLYERSWRALSMVCLPMALLVVLLADPVLRLLYGQAPAVAVVTLQVLAPTLVFVFLNTPNARLMILDKQQSVLARLLAYSTAANAILALLLVPRYDAPAAAAARAASMGIFFVLNAAYVERRILPTRPWRFVWKAAAATALMAAFVFLVAPDWPAWARAVAGMGVYAVALGGAMLLRPRGV